MASPQAQAMLAQARSGMTTGNFPGGSRGSAAGQSPLLTQWNQQSGLTPGWASTVYAGSIGLPRTWETFRSGDFPPLEPIYPVPIDIGEGPSGRPRPRRFQFMVGWNLPVGQPGTEGVKLANFQVLRDYGEVPSPVRVCIEVCKHDMETLNWDIVPTEHAARSMQGNPAKRKDFEKRKAEIMEFMTNPDPDNYDGFDDWFNAVMEDVIVLDALAVHIQPSTGKGNGPMGSNVGALALLDGSTVRPLLDEWGARPRVPEPAFQQIIWGVPRVDLMDLINLGPDATIEDLQEINPVLEELTQTTDQWSGDQLIYFRTNPRSWTPYGFGPLEQGILPAAIILARMQWQFEFFRSGSLPSVFMDPGPTIATPEEARQLQEAINMLGGDLAAMHQVIVLPPGAKTTEQKVVNLSSDFDTWVTALVAMPFGLSISDLGLTPKLASLMSPEAGKMAATAATDKTFRHSAIPRAKKLKRKIFDRLIQVILGQRDMEWSWGITEQGESRNDLVTQQIGLVHNSIASVDEARIALELDPFGLKETSVPLVFTATGATVLGAIPQVAAPGSTPVSTGGEVKPLDEHASEKEPDTISPAHAGSSAVEANPPDSHESADTKAVQSELATLRRYVKRHKSFDGFVPGALHKRAVVAGRQLARTDPEAAVALVGKAHQHLVKRDADLSPIRAKLLAELHGLVPLVKKQKFPAFVSGATAALHRAYADSYVAGAATESPGGQVSPDAQQVYDGWAGTRAHSQAQWLEGVALGVAGAAIANLEARFNLYAASTTASYESGAMSTALAANPAKVITWHLGDAEHCDLCIERDGKSFTEQTLPGFPGDGSFGGSLCVTGDTLVDVPLVEETFRRWYEGPVVEITTAGDRTLTCTPDHPVLTDKGWIAAQFLKGGDHVVGAVLAEGVGLGDPHVQNGPTRIDEICSTLALSRSGQRVAAVSLDLDGEPVVNDNVDVVGANGQLGLAVKSTSHKHVGHLQLEDTNVGATLVALGSHDGLPSGDISILVDTPKSAPVRAASERPTIAPPVRTQGMGLASSLAVGTSLIRREFAQPSTVTIAGGSENAESFDAMLDDVSSNAELVGDAIDGLTSEIPFSQLTHRARADLFRERWANREYRSRLGATYLDASGQETVPYESPADFEVLRELQLRDAAEVALDQVVNVNITPYAGHVYNLQTRGAFYVASGLVTHNCLGGPNCACWLSFDNAAGHAETSQPSLLRQMTIGQGPATTPSLRDAVGSYWQARSDFVSDLPSSVPMDEIYSVQQRAMLRDTARAAIAQEQHISPWDVTAQQVADRLPPGVSSKPVSTAGALSFPDALDSLTAGSKAASVERDGREVKDISMGSPLGSGFVPFDLEEGVHAIYPAPTPKKKRRKKRKAVAAPAAANTSTILFAGLVVVAEDSGRVLLIQRSTDDEEPSAGTWEWPGGHLEEGETPWAGASREWSEEVGVQLPTGHVVDTWVCPANTYQAFVYAIPHEVAVDLADRDQDMNPDGDQFEAVAWFDPLDLPGMPALRPEVQEQTPWSKLILRKAATKASKDSAPHKGPLEHKVHNYLRKHYPDKLTAWVCRSAWEKNDVPLDKIAYHNRPGGRDPKKVERMMRQIKKGDKKKRVVLVDPGSEGKMVVADGYHRLLAMEKLGIKDVRAWVGTPRPGAGDWRQDVRLMQMDVENASGTENDGRT